jgi:predicted DCC family thiol-disulfide oxidoreductase YuxK
MSSLGWPWRVAALMRVLPTTLLDRAYDLVAGNRYRVFGRNETCLLPRPEYVDRFVDIEPSLPPTPKGHDSTSPGEAV